MSRLKSSRNAVKAALGAAALATTVQTAAAAEQMPPYEGELEIRDYESPDFCDPEAMQVRVMVDGVEPRGILTVEIYGSDPDLFLEREGRVRRVRVPAEAGIQTLCMTVEEPGPFAVTTYHDRNGNRRIDKNFIGIPNEPFGLSNNPRLRLAKPRYDDVKFDLGMHGIDLWVLLQRY